MYHIVFFFYDHASFKLHKAFGALPPKVPIKHPAPSQIEPHTGSVLPWGCAQGWPCTRSSHQKQGTQTSQPLPHTSADNVESSSFAATSKTFPTSPSTGVWKQAASENIVRRKVRNPWVTFPFPFPILHFPLFSLPLYHNIHSLWIISCVHTAFSTFAYLTYVRNLNISRTESSLQAQLNILLHPPRRQWHNSSPRHQTGSWRYNLFPLCPISVLNQL